MEFEFDWIDAFAEKPFGGNACVVVHDAGDLDLDQRLALVRETSLSECAYIVPSDKADFGARYYLAEREILMAGHPTIATVQSLLERGHIEGNCSFTLEVGAGVLPIRVCDGLITMTQAAPEFMNTFPAGDIAGIYGISPDDIAGEPQVVSTGTPFCITVIQTLDAMKRARLDPVRLERWQRQDGNPQSNVMEPFLVYLGGVEGGDTFSRLLLAPPMPAEDPFTGSATGCMAAYLFSRRLIGSKFCAEQGHWIGRPGRAEVEILGAPDNISGVNVSGRAVRLMSGTLHL